MECKALLESSSHKNFDGNSKLVGNSIFIENGQISEAFGGIL